MAASPEWKVYDSKKRYQEACEEVEAAGSLASLWPGVGDSPPSQARRVDRRGRRRRLGTGVTRRGCGNRVSSSERKKLRLWFIAESCTTSIREP